MDKTNFEKNWIETINNLKEILKDTIFMEKIIWKERAISKKATCRPRHSPLWATHHPVSLPPWDHSPPSAKKFSKRKSLKAKIISRIKKNLGKRKFWTRTKNKKILKETIF